MPCVIVVACQEAGHLSCRGFEKTWQGVRFYPLLRQQHRQMRGAATGDV